MKLYHTVEFRDRHRHLIVASARRYDVMDLDLGISQDLVARAASCLRLHVACGLLQYVNGFEVLSGRQNDSGEIAHGI